MLWYQVICASAACTNDRSGQVSANAFMYLRFRGENPCISGNAARRSAERLSMILAPQPARSWRSTISRPICQ